MTRAITATLAVASDDSFPCDVTAEVFLEFGAMVAGLESGAILKPSLNGLLGLLDLLLELAEPAAQRQKHGQFQLCDWFYCGK
jgi:hypothetical protein